MHLYNLCFDVGPSPLLILPNRSSGVAMSLVSTSSNEKAGQSGRKYAEQSQFFQLEIRKISGTF